MNHKSIIVYNRGSTHKNGDFGDGSLERAYRKRLTTLFMDTLWHLLTCLVSGAVSLLGFPHGHWLLYQAGNRHGPKE